MSDVKWIKIVTDIFDDEKILLIEAMPESDAMIVIWFKILCLAGKQNNGGVLMLNDRMPYTDEMLSTIFRRSISTVRLALGTFQQLDMIEIVSGAVTIPNWEKHQSLDKLERVREQTRERVAEHRNKQKLLADCNANSNVTVTQCNETDKIRVDKTREDKSRIDNADKPRRFTKPTVEEVAEYCRERGNRINAQSFVDFYESKGWKVGSSPMKDWKSCVRTWEQRDKEKNPPKKEESNADRYAITEGFKTSF